MKKSPDAGLATRVSSVFVRLVRFRNGGSQRKLAQDTGVAVSTIATAERGRHVVSARTAARLAEAVGIPSPKLDLLLYALGEAFRQPGEPQAHPLPDGLRLRESAWEETVAGLARAFHGLLAWPRTVPPGAPPAPTAAVGEDAAALWGRLALYPAPQQRVLALGSRRFRSCELALLLCRQSLKAAGDSPNRAVELAELALLVARLAPASPARSAAVQASAQAHLGNALRVRGDHEASEQAFVAAGERWKAGGAESASLLPKARLLSFEASLRRAQRRFGEAADLLAEALSEDDGTLKSNLLLKRAKLLRDTWNLEEAVETLEQAEPHVASMDDPRLVFAARSNRAYYLSLLERHQEAEHWLAEARRLASAAGALDRLRLDWVAGRVAAGLGRTSEGIAALERVRREFAARGMAYDAALAALELASLYLANGQAARVKALVREMLPAFQSRDIHREALAALRVFRQAAEQERATAELARQIARFLHRARHDPEMRFAGGGGHFPAG